MRASQSVPRKGKLGCEPACNDDNGCHYDNPRERELSNPFPGTTRKSRRRNHLRKRSHKLNRKEKEEIRVMINVLAETQWEHR